MKKIYERRLDQYVKELTEEAVYVGEEGQMVCSATTALGAFRKFRRCMIEHCGEAEAEGMDIDYVGIAWLILPISYEKSLNQDGDPCDWLVTYEKPHENVPRRKVWMYA